MARSFSMGVIISMLFFYAIHLFGSWQVENYRPNPDTTYTLLLHNKCAVFNKTHTLRPNTAISAMDDGINGTKLGGSFMNFFDGHVIAMIIVAMFLGAIIYFLRRKKQPGSL